MTGFEPGDVILVPFPFSDLSGVKKRPALVLAVAERLQEMVCLMLTSLPEGQSGPHCAKLAVGRAVETHHRQAAQDFHNRPGPCPGEVGHR